MSDRTASPPAPTDTTSASKQPLFQFPERTTSSPSSGSNIPGISAPTGITGQPSQIHGHLQYVKGATSDLIGRMTSSQAWQSSGQAAQFQGINEMRAAKELANKEGPNRSLTATTNTTAPEVPGEPGLGEKPTYASKVGDTGFLKAEGKAETMAGKVLGCMGMVKDGEEKSRSAAVLERTGDPDGRVGK